MIIDGAAVPLVTFIYTLKGGLSTIDRIRARALEGLVLVQAMIGGLQKSGATINFNGATIAGTGTPGISAGWIDKLAAITDNTVGSTWRDRAIPTGSAVGWGAHEAARGALMHHCSITAGKITKYQAIVPTTWNGSPKDAAGNRGAFEVALLGTPFDAAQSSFTKQAGGSQNTESGIEVLRVLQSFDPCIACAVH